MGRAPRGLPLRALCAFLIPAFHLLPFPFFLLFSVTLIPNCKSLRGRRQWQPTPVLLPGESHGQKSLVGCSPWGCEESDTTERLHFHFSLSCIGEGNGNPLQCSCQENPRDGGAWWAAIYGVAQSRTRLTRLSSSSSSSSKSLRDKNDVLPSSPCVLAKLFQSRRILCDPIDQ